MKTVVGIIGGFILGYMIWFPYGIYYTIQANSGSKLVRTISIVKGLFEL